MNLHSFLRWQFSEGESRLIRFASATPEKPDLKVEAVVKEIEQKKISDSSAVEKAGDEIRTQTALDVNKVFDVALKQFKDLGIPEEKLKELTTVDQIMKIAERFGWVRKSTPEVAQETPLDFDALLSATFKDGYVLMQTGEKYSIGQLEQAVLSLDERTPEGKDKLQKGFGMISKWIEQRVEGIRMTLIRRTSRGTIIRPSADIVAARKEFLYLLNAGIKLEGKVADAQIFNDEERKQLGIEPNRPTYAQLKSQLLAEVKDLPRRQMWTRNGPRYDIRGTNAAFSLIRSRADEYSYVRKGEDLKTTAFFDDEGGLRKVYASRSGFKGKYYENMTPEQRGDGKPSRVGIMGRYGEISGPYGRPFDFSAIPTPEERKAMERQARRGGNFGGMTFNQFRNTVAGTFPESANTSPYIGYQRFGIPSNNNGGDTFRFSPGPRKSVDVSPNNPNMRVANLVRAIADYMRAGQISNAYALYDQLNSLLDSNLVPRFTVTVRDDARIGQRANAEPLIAYYEGLARQGTPKVEKPNFNPYALGTQAYWDWQNGGRPLQREREIRAAEEKLQKVYAEFDSYKSSYPKGVQRLREVAENTKKSGNSFYANFLKDVDGSRRTPLNEQAGIDLGNVLAAQWERNVKNFIEMLERWPDGQRLPTGPSSRPSTGL